MERFFTELKRLGLRIRSVDGDLILSGQNRQLDKEELREISENEYLTSFIRTNKQKILDYLGRQPEKREEAFLNHENIDAIYGLSPLQEGMLFHYNYDKATRSYVEQTCLDFTEGIDVGALRASFQYIFKKHSILRTCFFAKSLKTSLQCVLKTVEFPLDLEDWCHLNLDEQEQAFRRFLETDLEKGFELDKAPLMRVNLFKTAERYYRMVWTFHHIILDGWSVSKLVTQLLSVYRRYLDNETVPEPVEDKYEAFIRYLDRRDKFQEERFWKSYLSGSKGQTLIPFVHAGSERNRGRNKMKRLNLQLSKALSERISTFCKQEQLTPNSLLQGVWSFLLSGYLDHTDVVFGTTVSGRPSDLKDGENKVGLYINTIPFRAKLEDEKTIVEWLRSLQAGHTEARSFQYASLNEIQQWAGIKGTFFDSLLVFENYPSSQLFANTGARLKIDNVRTVEQSNYLLTIIAGMKEKLDLSFSYNKELLSTGYVEMIKDQFENILRIMVDNTGLQLKDLRRLLAEQEKPQFDTFNDTGYAYPEDQTVEELFVKQAQKSPDTVALSFRGKTLTYRELDEQSAQVARYLHARGAKAGDRIGICMERSFELIIGILGILKAGGTYVPVDPEYPASRIRFTLENADAGLVLVSERTRQIGSGFQAFQSVVLSKSNWSNLSKEPVGYRRSSKSAAYLMYTSGSSGTPKGALISHQGISRLVFNQCFPFLDDKTVLYQFAPATFDASTFEIWGALLKGGTLAIASPGKLTVEQIGEELKKNRVNVLWLTSALFHTVADTNPEILSGIKYLLAGGDSINVKNIERILEGREDLTFINGYGPTESTTFAVTNTVNGLDDLDKTKDVIGRPIGNTRAFILDWDNGQLLPKGWPGELCLSGPGLSSGYHKSPEMTQRKFIGNPYGRDKNHERIYRTGDMARWLPDGKIEFLGRKDDQVKIRGFRIELGEINKVLSQYTLIRQSAVMVRKTRNGEKILVAYVVPEQAFDREAIRQFLRSRLPYFMCPSVIVPLDAFPMTRNGKLDRKALPMLHEVALNGNDFQAPSNEMEKQLAEIWQELLNIEKISILDDFFELGGHSLLATRLATAIDSAFQITAPLKSLFKYTTIASQAKYLNILIKNNEEIKGETFSILEI